MHRRHFLAGAGAAAGWAAIGAPLPSLAANPVERKLHGLSAFGELALPEDFAQFSYARPEAPQGGSFAFQPSNWAYNQNHQTFNTLNSFILKGAAPPRMELCFDTLMVRAWDEPDALYCSLARNVEISADRNSFTFELREEARFHDGTPVTAHDAAFSYMLLREEGHPRITAYLDELEEAVALDDATLQLRFSGKQSARAVLAMLPSVPVFSKAFHEQVPFADHVSEKPLGSGPWRVGEFEFGRFIEYERVRDHWGRDLGVFRGLDHFDRLRIDFFLDRQAGFEAFKKGETRWRQEFTSKTWATEYGFPAMERGEAVQMEFPGEQVASLQGWALNARRKRFANPLTRQAIGMVFDFEWTNRSLFYDAYERSHSLFGNSEFAAEGLPDAAELALIEPFRNTLPEAVFGEAVRQPVSDGSGRNRAAQREAIRLLEAAGWQRNGDGLVDADGERLTIEFLIRAPVFERILGPYTENLRRIGVDASIRLVDGSQFQARVESFDFDAVGLAFNYGATPGMETLMQFFHSTSAARQGSQNYPGIALEAADRLVEKCGEAESREELAVCLRALDRVLRAHHFWIPNWFSANHRVAMWDMFGWPEPKPDYAFPVERMWWQDPQKAERLGIAG